MQNHLGSKSPRSTGDEDYNMDISKEILSDITVHMKYARFDAEKQRRENWQELSNRNMDMHIKRYPTLEQ